jgi:hypothetical protein
MDKDKLKNELQSMKELLECKFDRLPVAKLRTYMLSEVNRLLAYTQPTEPAPTAPAPATEPAHTELTTKNVKS